MRNSDFLKKSRLSVLAAIVAIVSERTDHIEMATGTSKRMRLRSIENLSQEKRKMNYGRIVPRQIEKIKTDTGVSVAADQQHTCYSSTDYTKFSLIRFNRPVSEEKVQKLLKAFRENRNYLHIYPIVVNRQFEVLDGQHRLEAAKRAGVPIFYIIDDDFRMEDAIAANNVVGKWTTEQFMNSFAEREFPEYVKIRDFYLEHPWIKISTLPKLCSTKGYGKLNFDNGHYEADRMEFAHKVAAMVNSFRPFIGDKQAEFNPFVQTVMNLAANHNYNHKRMVEKMKQRGSLFQRCATVPQYLAILTEIYNYRVAPENRISLTEDFIRSRWQR